MFFSIELLGILGGFIVNSSILPQIVKCARTKSTRDFSWQMFGIYYVGILINFCYGIIIHRPAIYLTCIYSFCTNTTLVYMKWQFEKDTPSANANIARLMALGSIRVREIPTAYSPQLPTIQEIEN